MVRFHRRSVTAESLPRADSASHVVAPVAPDANAGGLALAGHVGGLVVDRAVRERPAPLEAPDAGLRTYGGRTQVGTRAGRARREHVVHPAECTLPVRRTAGKALDLHGDHAPAASHARGAARSDRARFGE